MDAPESGKLPYRRMIFVCTRSREDGRISCANPGRPGKEICEALKAGVKRAGLKHKVCVAQSGCMDLCGQGPNVVVWPEGAWYKGASLEQVPAILERHVEPLKDDG